MKLQVNGEERELGDGTATIAALLTELRYSFPLLIIRINGELIPRENYSNAAIATGDDVDIYHLVSGG